MAVAQPPCEEEELIQKGNLARDQHNLVAYDIGDCHVFLPSTSSNLIKHSSMRAWSMSEKIFLTFEVRL
ncbi:hypothetical protein SAY87_030140 [Trapa incisa]|uniref:Uncharacterized protein n=1 Tax=Trapa incisa TaxID=236973 RepID=A0AAN7Q9W2_9MYRT|nr:hypothetical protein SAY87_030140 [Trapa incisa]